VDNWRPQGASSFVMVDGEGAPLTFSSLHPKCRFDEAHVGRMSSADVAWHPGRDEWLPCQAGLFPYC